MAVSSAGSGRLRGAMRRVPWSLAALGALFAAIIAAQISVVGQPEFEVPVFGVGFLLLDLLGLGLSIRAATSRRLHPTVRRPWRFMAPALLMHTASTVAFAAAGIAGSHAMEWVAIASRLAMVPFLLAAVLTFPMRRLTASERYKLALDVTTVAGGGFIVMWYFIVGPALTSGQPASLVVSLAGFPLGDLVVIFGVCAVLMRGGTASLRHPLTILLAGLTNFLAADAYYSYAELEERGQTISLGVRIWLLSGTLLMAAAAAQQLRHTAAARPTGAAGTRGGVASQLPYAGLATGYLLLLFATAREDAMFPWGGLVGGVIVMTGAVAVRQVIAMRENQDLVVTDSLTGLANRVRLRARLGQVLDRRQPVAVLLIDLDGFKQVNDTLGHEAGDGLLVAFAGVLRDCVRPSDTASRLGGDEFAVVLPEIIDVEQAGVVADRILAAAAVPVRLGDAMVPIRCSVGVALSRPGDGIQCLLHRADVAMYAAKRTRSHGWLAYSRGMDGAPNKDDDLSRDVSGALANGQLRLSYERVVALADGQATAVQAMVTWQHPTHGLLTPETFLPIAEQTGAIDDIGRWVLEQTCHQAQRTGPGGGKLRANVKVSAHQLRQPGLVTDVLVALARCGLDPHTLVIELPADTPVGDERTIATLTALREHGVRLAVADFRAGYSSLHHVNHLPIDILKQDNCYVAELDGTRESTAIVATVIGLSRVLHRDAGGQLSGQLSSADPVPELLQTG